MRVVRLSSIDTHLLVTLDALLQEESVHGAARRIALSPSATSHALARLRELFGDPLLVRAGRRLRRTPRAEALAPRVREVVSAMEALFQPPESFTPGTLERTFELLTTDHIEFVLMRRLDTVLTAEAPRVRLHSRPIVPDAAAELRNGTVDLAYGTFRSLPDDILQEALFTDRFVTLVRAGHPVLRGPFTLKRFVELDHVLVAPRGTAVGTVDALLAERGLKRRVTRVLGSFLPAPFLVAQSDAVVTMSARLAEPLVPLLGLKVLEPPLPVQPYTLCHIWHRRNDADPAHAWFRGLTARVAASLPRLPVREQR